MPDVGANVSRCCGLGGSWGDRRPGPDARGLGRRIFWGVTKPLTDRAVDQKIRGYTSNPRVLNSAPSVSQMH